MIKYVYPTFKECDKIKACIETGDKLHPTKLPVDLKRAFHLGYRDRPGDDPAEGENPFFDEYKNLLEPAEELRFKKKGLANDAEGKKAESGKLGRCFALYVLEKYYSYTWSASISNLRETPEKGWSAHKKNDKGDSPDWLVTGNGKFAVAEAKGRHDPIPTTGATRKKWREQVKNIIIKQHGKGKSFKTWIIASRFVTSNDPMEKPQMLIEDPPLPGVPITEEDNFSLSYWIIQSHVLANLERMRLYELALRLREPKTEKQWVIVWRCVHPQLKDRLFIGRMVPAYMNHFRWLLPYIDAEEDFPYITWFLGWYRHMSRDGFFDGVDIDMVRPLLSGQLPSEVQTENFDGYPYISLLSDGSLLAPASLVYPAKMVEF